jgi:hypothetical protein
MQMKAEDDTDGAKEGKPHGIGDGGAVSDFTSTF